jgi:hypothetical protein
MLVKTMVLFQIFAACLYSRRSHSESFGSQCSMIKRGCFFRGTKISKERKVIMVAAKKYLNLRNIDPVVLWIK